MLIYEICKGKFSGLMTRKKKANHKQNEKENLRPSLLLIHGKTA